MKKSSLCLATALSIVGGYALADAYYDPPTGVVNIPHIKIGDEFYEGSLVMTDPGTRQFEVDLDSLSRIEPDATFSGATGTLSIPMLLTSDGIFTMTLDMVDREELIFVVDLNAMERLTAAVDPDSVHATLDIERGILDIPHLSVNGKLYHGSLELLDPEAMRFQADLALLTAVTPDASFDGATGELAVHRVDIGGTVYSTVLNLHAGDGLVFAMDMEQTVNVDRTEPDPEPEPEPDPDPQPDPEPEPEPDPEPEPEPDPDPDPDPNPDPDPEDPPVGSTARTLQLLITNTVKEASNGARIEVSRADGSKPAMECNWAPRLGTSETYPETWVLDSNSSGSSYILEEGEKSPVEYDPSTGLVSVSHQGEREVVENCAAGNCGGITYYSKTDFTWEATYHPGRSPVILGEIQETTTLSWSLNGATSVCRVTYEMEGRLQ